jgi:hypothetical protein
MKSTYTNRCLMLILPVVFVACEDQDKPDGGGNKVIFEEPVLPVDPVKVEDVMKGVGGDWASDDKLVYLSIKNNRFSFTVAPQAQPWLIELDNLLVSLDEHMTFERCDVVYDLSWTFAEPGRIRLTAKGVGWNEVKGVSLAKE